MGGLFEEQKAEEWSVILTERNDCAKGICDRPEVPVALQTEGPTEFSSCGRGPAVKEPRQGESKGVRLSL